MFITSYKPILQKNRLMSLEPVRDYLCDDGDDVVKSTTAAARVFVDCIRLHEEADEHMVVLCLNSSGHVTGMFEMTGGSINAVHFDIAGIIRKVLMMNCATGMTGRKGKPMSITLKDPQTTLDILDTETMTRYIRDHIQVITAHTEECRESAGVCISIVAPPFIQFFDAIHNRVNVVIDIEKPQNPAETPKRQNS